MENVCLPQMSRRFQGHATEVIGMEGGLSHWYKGALTNYLIKQERINSIIEDSTSQQLHERQTICNRPV